MNERMDRGNVFKYPMDSPLSNAHEGKLVSYKGGLLPLGFPESNSFKLDNCAMIRRKYYTFNSNKSVFDKSLN